MLEEIDTTPPATAADRQPSADAFIGRRLTIEPECITSLGPRDRFPLQGIMDSAQRSDLAMSAGRADSVRSAKVLHGPRPPNPPATPASTERLAVALFKALVQHIRQPYPGPVHSLFDHGQVLIVVIESQLRPRLDPLACCRVYVRLPGRQQRFRGQSSTVPAALVSGVCELGRTVSSFSQ